MSADRLSWSWRGGQLAVELAGARAVFTTRRGGVSAGPWSELNLGLGTDDDPAAVRENRRRVATALGVRLAQGRQVHGTEVRRVDEPDDPPREADGQVTSTPGVAPTVLAADCLPVALVGPTSVAMLHCGWRGLAGGIVKAGARALGERPLAAAIGPGAGVCCYEAGEEVHAAFARHGPGVRRGRRVDLPGVARRELTEAGVLAVEESGICTICGDPALWYSHRRDGGVTGRQAGIVWRA